MSTIKQITPDYDSRSYGLILQSLTSKIKEARLRATITVNTQLLHLYWEIGTVILERQTENGWGAKIIDQLAADLKAAFPDMKGLSVRNLKYMRAFAEAYPQFVQPLVAQLQNSDNQHLILSASLQDQLAKLVSQLPWTHNIVLLDRLPEPEKRLFYARKCVQNGWSKSLLIHQIESNLSDRQGNAITNFDFTLPNYQSDLARETFKNPYLFDFLNLGEEAHECINLDLLYRKRRHASETGNI